MKFPLCPPLSLSIFIPVPCIRFSCAKRNAGRSSSEVVFREIEGTLNSARIVKHREVRRNEESERMKVAGRGNERRKIL